MIGARLLHLRRLALVAAIGCCSLLAGVAHGPFDSSTHITLGEELLEVSVILGPDAARQFLADHLPGLPPPQPVGRGLELPVAVATNLFSLSTSAAMLVPKELRVLTDGLEFTFVAGFGKPDSAQLQFHARFFGVDERIAPGVFDVRTEDGKLIATEILSRSTATAPIALPARSDQLVVSAATDLPHPFQVSNDPVVLTNRVGSKSNATPNHFAFWAAFALVIVLAAGWSYRRRSQRR